MSLDDRTRSHVFEGEAGGRRVLAFWPGGFTSRSLPASAAITIGRALDCDVAIDHPSVSRRHARVHGGSPAEIEDLGSANGTRVGKRLLRSGERASLTVDVVAEVGAALVVLREDVTLGAGPTARPAQGQATPSAAGIEQLVRLAAASPLSVILLGETGVGKEVTAHTLHRLSPRSTGPFVGLNCAALSETLLEAELFGYARGAFTGAVKDKPGLLETANGGTVFLDELGEMPLTTQAKMLRAVETREVLRVGAVQPRPIDVRFIAATNRDLGELVVRGGFRRDLFYRLNGVSIRIPPLRARREEIPALVRTFLQKAEDAAGRGPMTISIEAMAALLAHSWPGNIRELRAVVERSVFLCETGTIGVQHLGLDAPMTPHLPPPAEARVSAQQPVDPGDVGLRRSVQDHEKARIMEALERCDGNQTRAAELLGVSRRTLVTRLTEYGLTRPRKDAPPRK